MIKRCIQRKKRQISKELIKNIEVISAPIELHEVEQPSLLDPPSKVKLTNDCDLDFGDFEL